jgi:hypothetical protein
MDLPPARVVWRCQYREGHGWLARQGRYPGGSIRAYDSDGVPTNAAGEPLGSSGVDQADTHFPLSGPDELPFDPIIE